MANTYPVDDIVEIAHHSEVFYQDPEFWVAVAFILVVGVMALPVSRIVGKMITKRIIRIKSELQEAEKLKLDAQKVYAEYERKLMNVDAEVEQIVSEQNRLISEMKELKLQSLNNLLRQRQREADGRMEIAIEHVNSEINELIGKKSMEMVRSVLQNHLSEKELSRLVDSSIENIKNI